MKEQLESQGYDNVEVIPNCKELDILDAKTISILRASHTGYVLFLG